MNTTAYLLVFINSTTHQVEAAGIYSESAQSLTLDRGNCTPATVFEMQGKTYAEAERAVMASVRGWAYLSWLLPFLERDSGLL